MAENDAEEVPVGADEEQVERLVGSMSDRDAEYELDLRGLDHHHAHHAILNMFSKPFDRQRTVLIHLDPPDGRGGQSLFQPVATLLRDAISAGRVVSARPVSPEHGLGFRVTLPANQQG